MSDGQSETLGSVEGYETVRAVDQGVHLLPRKRPIEDEHLMTGGAFFQFGELSLIVVRVIHLQH